MPCDARILAAHPRTPGVTTTVIASCDGGAGACGPDIAPGVFSVHEGPAELGDGMPTVTRIRWHNDDRRTFRGELVMCDRLPDDACTLPADHRGDCAP